MVEALVEGDENILEKMVEKKLETVGASLISNALNGGGSVDGATDRGSDYVRRYERI